MPPDPVRRLAEVATDVAPALLPAGATDALRAIAEAARASFGAAAASVAVLDEEAGELEYLAAAGAGAEAVEGLRLALGRGLAGYVASTGQSLAVDRVQDDPRFAADVAERTGYVPSSVLVVPIVDAGGTVLGVLSILDRTAPASDLALAARFADAAGRVLPLVHATRRLGAVLLLALADAVASGDRDLAAALRRRAGRAPAGAPDLASLAALFAELRDLGPREQAAAVRLLEEFAGYARSRRRR